jgi:rubrerythrin
MGVLARLLGLRGGGRTLIDDLAADYRAEMEQAILLRQHAERAKYPQIADSLRQLAVTEERHAGWLRDRLVARGEAPPDVAAVRSEGRNLWERACDARARAQRKRRQRAEHVIRWDPDEPDLVELWRQIESEDAAEYGAYETIVMRGDPHAID